MKSKQTLLTLGMLIAFCGILHAQTRNVTGTIAGTDGKPIAGVSVRLKGAVTVANSDQNGTYSITVAEKSTETLIFSHQGYDELEVVVIGKSQLNVTLTSSVRYNQYGQQVSRKALFAEDREGILTFESKDESFRFWTDIRLNVDFTKHFDNYDNSLSVNGNPDSAIQLSDGGHIRRARIAFKAQLSDKWYGEIDMDFRDLELDMNDVYLEYSATDRLSFKVGQFREPFGMMTNTTSRYVSFMERPLSSEMDPSRHVGVGASYFRPRFFTGLGIFTDEVYGIEAKDVRRKIRTGTEASKAITGRFMGYPINRNNLTLGIGIGGSYRTPQITDEGSNTVRVRVNDENRTSQKRFLDTDAIPNVKNIILANGELAFAWNSFRLQSEYKIMTLNRGKIYTDVNYTGQNLNDAHYSGYYVEIGYYLFGDMQNFNYREGEFTRVRPNSKKGTIELSARYSTLELNDEDAGVFGGEGKITAFGITYWAHTNARIILNVAYVDHDENASTKYKWNVPAGGFDYTWIGTRFEIDF
ncbi:MAG TPA: porin [Bacteroidales bacterium]|nr:porin [Bacteroidales bacterium]HRZ49980.1 porin [Bacteroidales bacterium]